MEYLYVYCLASNLGKTMRILIIVPNFQYGGTEKTVERLAKYLSCEFSVCILTLGNKLDLDSVEHKEYNLAKFSYMKAMGQIYEIIKFHKINHVHCFGELPIALIILCSFFKRLFNFSITAHVRNNEREFVNATGSKLKKLARYVILYISLHVSDRIFANSRTLAEDTKKYFSLKRVSVFPNQTEISTDKIANRHTRKTSIRMIGRGGAQKQYGMAIKVFNEYRNLGGSCNLEIFGEVDRVCQERLLALATVPDCVVFHGFVQDPWRCSGRVLCLLMTSKYEGSPNVMLEAMQRGVAVATSFFHHGPQELLIDTKLGELVAPEGDISQLSNILLQLEDNEYRTSIAFRLLEVAKKFSSADVFAHFVKEIKKG